MPMIAEINTMSDVIKFIESLIIEGTNAHPDDDFNDYINIHTGLPTYTTGQAQMRNELMRQSFDIAGIQQQDLYEVMQKIYMEGTELGNPA
jgi:hypothetical protein